MYISTFLLALFQLELNIYIYVYNYISLHKYTWRNYTKSREVAGSILNGVTQIFHGAALRLGSQINL